MPLEQLEELLELGEDSLRDLKLRKERIRVGLQRLTNCKDSLFGKTG